MALNHCEVLSVQLPREHDIEGLQEADNEVRAHNIGVLLNVLVQKFERVDEDLSPWLLVDGLRVFFLEEIRFKVLLVIVELERLISSCQHQLLL